MKTAITLAAIATALKTSKRTAERRANKEAWPFEEQPTRGGRQRIYQVAALPAEVQAALAKMSAPVAAAIVPATLEYDREELWANYARKSQTLKDKAEHRCAIVHQVCRLMGNGLKLTRALAGVAAANGESAKTIERWFYAVQGYAEADWLPALAPDYSGRTAVSEFDIEAFDFYKADYLRPSQPAHAACYERLARAGRGKGWKIPSARTLMRRIDTEISKAQQILARQGVEALARLYPAQRRDRSMLHALEAVNSDGHTIDVFVKWPDGEVARPKLVGWQDLYSGKLLSYRVDKTENTDSIRLSFGDVVEEYGIPGAAFLDNGRGFASKWFTGGTPNRYRFKVKAEDPVGILTLLLGPDGIRWVTPYHGQAKPIERAWRDLAEYVSRHPAFEGAYTGNKPDAKPANYGSKAVPLAEFMSVLAEEIKAHNARTGRKGSVNHGRSFDQTFAESYATSPIRKATAEQRRLWLLAAELTTAKKSGEITIPVSRNNRYWAEELTEYAGQQLVVRFDPLKLHGSVYVYSTDGRYICEARCIEDAGFMDSEAAREHQRARNQFKRGVKLQLEAEVRMDAAAVAGVLSAQGASAPALAEAHVVKLHRPLQEIERPRAPEVSPEQVAEVVEMLRHEQLQDETEEQRFARWFRLDSLRRAGQELCETDRFWMESYQQTSEFNGRKFLFDEFGPERMGLEVG